MTSLSSLAVAGTPTHADATAWNAEGGRDDADARTGIDIFSEDNLIHLLLVLWLTLFAVTAVWNLNKRYAPDLHDAEESVAIAEAFADGQNFAVFDLNINTRTIRDEHIARLETAPDVAILGASHWQEAPASLVTHKNFYNAHVHRDYYEDMLGMVEMFERHDKLPKQLIITLRDRLFTPVAERTDALWYQGVPYYRRMAERLGLEQHEEYETLPVETWRQRLSLSLLFKNFLRYHFSAERPHPTDASKFDGLDVLLPGGSIVWSREHDAQFTQERAQNESLAFAASNANNPLSIDRRGVIAIDRLIEHLTNKGVEVFLAHPPFNPIYWDAVQGTAYMEGLERIEELARSFARKYDLEIVGSFNPHEMGCEASVFIDAEHSSADCIGRVLKQYAAIDQARSPAEVERFTPAVRDLAVPGLIADPYLSTSK